MRGNLVMLTEQFKLIRETLHDISTYGPFRPGDPPMEIEIFEFAKDALATGDVQKMWEALVEISLRQGDHKTEKRMIDIAQDAVKKLLLQLKLLNHA